MPKAHESHHVAPKAQTIPVHIRLTPFKLPESLKDIHVDDNNNVSLPKEQALELLTCGVICEPVWDRCGKDAVDWLAQHHIVRSTF